MPCCDAHVHVFDPQRFAYVTGRRFTPPQATVVALDAFHAGLGVDHVVLVQPSVYGSDHRCMLDALRTMHGRAKGVAVLGLDACSDAIADMEALGVCGDRVNLEVLGVRDPESARRRVHDSLRRSPGHWHLQLHAHLGTIDAIRATVASSPKPVVLDHFGLPSIDQGTQQPGWKSLLELASAGRVFVKLSAPYMVSGMSPPYPDLQPFAESLARHAPDAMLWGSNWPHTRGSTRSADATPADVESFRVEDDAALLAQLTNWLGPSLSRRMLVDNPARLYGFQAMSLPTATAACQSA